jgi:hypothetical protein
MAFTFALRHEDGTPADPVGAENSVSPANQPISGRAVNSSAPVRCTYSIFLQIGQIRTPLSLCTPTGCSACCLGLTASVVA